MQHAFSSRWIRYFIPNIGTLILMALMLLVYRASAAPNGPAAPDATPGTISYQGMLNDAAGQPINGSTNITFRLYSVPTGGTALWTEAHTGANAVPVSNGLFNVLLGSLTPIPASVWSNANVYLGVQVGGDAEMSPREEVNAVPIALVANQARNVPQVQSGIITTTGAYLPNSDQWTDVPDWAKTITLDKPSTVFVSGHSFSLPAPDSGSELRVVIGDNVGMLVRYQANWEAVPLHHVVHLAPGTYVIKVQSHWAWNPNPGTTGIVGNVSQLSYFVFPDPTN
jgi:hypothetical protein